jgi:pimeloyl-ACP methyl ester carboxylesterase
VAAVLRLQIDGAALEAERYGPATLPADPPALRSDPPAGGGQAAALVFLHEGLGSLTQWRGWPQALCTRTARAGLAYARAGHGRSQPPRRRHGIRAMHHEAEVVLPEVIGRFGLERVVLVGHSDGASIALIAAAARPAWLAGAVLLAPHVMVEDRTVAGIAAAGLAYRSTDLGARLARHHDGPDELFRSWHDLWLTPEFRRWDLRPLLGTVQAPLLLIQGVDDEYGTMAQLDEISRRVRGPVARLELAACGHSPHLERRDATLAVTAGFLHRQR